nr:serine carboxypeptidase-like 16 [Tanacetum cinerariifolium]
MANVIFVDMPAGAGFSYATTKEASISSDSIVVKQANDFLRKFLIDHPKFLKNPLYISGISYMGIVTPIVTLELYNANERGDQPALNIQGYILCSPLTNKYMDFNSRVEYAHRMALISDDIYKEYYYDFAANWANDEAVQQALDIRKGKMTHSATLMISTVAIPSIRNFGDHDMTFPYVGIEEWIGSLNLALASQWKPFYVDNQVGE